MTQSFTRYTVEGCKHFDSANEALAEACRMIYATPEKRAIALAHLGIALAHLGAGRPVTLTYGFCSVTVSPPRETHPEIVDPRAEVKP